MEMILARGGRNSGRGEVTSMIRILNLNWKGEMTSTINLLRNGYLNLEVSW